MDIFQDMAKNASETKNETVLRMSDDGFLLVVSHREGGNYSCQAMDFASQCIFMDHVYAAAKYEPALLKPYNSVEVDAYESKYGVSLPPLLRYYLIHVSRESCCDPIRTIVDLEACPTTSHFIHSNTASREIGSEAEMVPVLTLQYTEHKLIILMGIGAGLMVATNDDKKGAYDPLWMSVFLPCGAAKRRAMSPTTSETDVEAGGV